MSKQTMELPLAKADEMKETMVFDRPRRKHADTWNERKTWCSMLQASKLGD